MQWLARVFASAFVRKLGYAAAVALLAVFTHCAQAANCTQYCLGQCSGSPAPGPWFPDVDTACRWLGSQTTGGVFGFGQDYVRSSGGICFWKARLSNGTLEANERNTSPAARTGDFCVPDGCASTLAVAMGSVGQEFSTPVSGAVAPSRVCTGNCTYVPRSTGPGAGMNGKLGTQWTYTGMDASQWIGLGTSCSGAAAGSPGTPISPPQPYPQPLEPGTCPGTVNGVSVIVPCDSTSTGSATSPSGSASSASSTASSPGGTPAGTSSTGSSTTCTGTLCTTTTTTTTNNPGGTTTTTTGTETEDKGDFCSEHPGNPQCKGEEDDPKDPCDDAPDRAACKNLGTLEVTPLESSVVTVAIERNDGFGPSTASCPAPQTVSLRGTTYSFSWQPFCDFATGIRPFIVGLAWITAAIGFMGLSRRGG